MQNGNPPIRSIPGSDLLTKGQIFHSLLEVFIGIITMHYVCFYMCKSREIDIIFFFFAYNIEPDHENFELAMS